MGQPRQVGGVWCIGQFQGVGFSFHVSTASSPILFGSTDHRRPVQIFSRVDDISALTRTNLAGFLSNDQQVCILTT
jgi:hypothetical protein